MSKQFFISLLKSKTGVYAGILLLVLITIASTFIYLRPKADVISDRAATCGVQKPVISLAASPTTIAEKNGAATVTLTRTNPNNNLAPLTVYLQDFKLAGSTADMDTGDGSKPDGQRDYNSGNESSLRVNTTVVFENNKTTALVKFVARDDTVNEGNETIQVQLIASGSYTLDANPAKQKTTLTIQDDDKDPNLPTASVTVSDAAASENKTGATPPNPGEFALSVDKIPAAGVTVNYTMADSGKTGMATEGTDYETTPHSVVFKTGDALTKKIPITVKDDLLVEGDELVKLRLTASIGKYNLANINEAQLTIKDDDAAATPPPTATPTPPVTYTVTVHVVNGLTNQPFPNVPVTMDNANQKLTNSNGDALYSGLQANSTHTFKAQLTVGSEGATASQTLTVTRNQTVTLTVRGTASLPTKLKTFASSFHYLPISARAQDVSPIAIPSSAPDSSKQVSTRPPCPKPVILEVKVFDSKTKIALSGANIYDVYTSNKPKLLGQTDKDGKFRKTDLKTDARIVLQVKRDKFRDSLPSEELDLKDAPEITKVDVGLDLVGSNTIQGTVTVKNKTKPIKGIVVQVYKNDKLIIVDMTDKDGKYKAKDLEAGTYKLKLYKKDPNSIPPAASVWESSTITFSNQDSGKVVTQDVDLGEDIGLRYYNLRVHLKDKEARNQSSMGLGSVKIETDSLAQEKTTEYKKGAYFEHIPEGTYKITAKMKDYEDEIEPAYELSGPEDDTRILTIYLTPVQTRCKRVPQTNIKRFFFCGKQAQSLMDDPKYADYWPAIDSVVGDLKSEYHLSQPQQIFIDNFQGVDSAMAYMHELPECPAPFDENDTNLHEEEGIIVEDKLITKTDQTVDNVRHFVIHEMFHVKDWVNEDCKGLSTAHDPFYAVYKLGITLDEAKYKEMLKDGNYDTKDPEFGHPDSSDEAYGSGGHVGHDHKAEFDKRIVNLADTLKQTLQKTVELATQQDQKNNSKIAQQSEEFTVVSGRLTTNNRPASGMTVNIDGDGDITNAQGEFLIITKKRGMRPIEIIHQDSGQRYISTANGEGSLTIDSQDKNLRFEFSIKPAL